MDETLLEELILGFQEQWKYINTASNQATEFYIAQLRDDISMVAKVVHKYLPTQVAIFMRACGYEGSLPAFTSVH